jgi:hypothetical protein
MGNALAQSDHRRSGAVRVGSVNGILPHALQKMSILYYLQSLCPVPAPMDDDAPTLIWRRLPRRRRVRKRSSACCC